MLLLEKYYHLNCLCHPFSLLSPYPVSLTPPSSPLLSLFFLSPLSLSSLPSLSLFLFFLTQLFKYITGTLEILASCYVRKHVLLLS